MTNDNGFDVLEHLGAVKRTVAHRERDGRLARVVTATREYETTIEDVWDALTNAERIPRWFLPISGDLRLGGHYQLEGNASGEITECVPPTLLGLTWGMMGEGSWVKVQLTQLEPERTRLHLEHTAYVPEEIWGQFGPGGVGVGWDLAILGLGEHLRTGKPADRGEFEAWTVSDEGKAYVRGSSDDWAQASIADGTPEDAAREAAARTFAFYTGAPPDA